ncbi:hypothetical protein Tco_0633793, partial [Tanacetum coccineum]
VTPPRRVFTKMKHRSFIVILKPDLQRAICIHTGLEPEVPSFFARTLASSNSAASPAPLGGFLAAHSYKFK